MSGLKQVGAFVVPARWPEDYGAAANDLIGRCHYDVFPDIPERWLEIHRRCLAGETLRCEEDPFPRADGHLDWVRWEVIPTALDADPFCPLAVGN